MKPENNSEFLEFCAALAKLRLHLAADPSGTALMEDAFNKLCRHYNSDQVARAGRFVIANILGQHPHLHYCETPVEDWGFEVVVSCDNCEEQETHRVVKHAVDIAAAVYLVKHEGCRPKPRFQQAESPGTIH